MVIHRTSKTGNFTIADNGFSVDQTLDWDAKGMLIYLLTKPDRWRINKGNLIHAVNGAGEKRVESILKKLETARYLIRWQSRNSKGQIIYDCEILESFKQYEDVLKALIAAHSSDKHFKITAPPLSQCGENQKPENQKPENSLGVKKAVVTKNEDQKLAALAQPTRGESRGGSAAPLVITQKILKTEDSLSPKGSLSDEPEERERGFANASKSEEPDPIATEPDSAAQPIAPINGSNPETQSAAPPPEIFGIKKWADFKGPGPVQGFWESALKKARELPERPVDAEMVAQSLIRKNGHLMWPRFEAIEAKRKADIAAAQTIAAPKPCEPAIDKPSAIAALMLEQNLTPAQVLSGMRSDPNYKYSMAKVHRDPEVAWTELSNGTLNLVYSYLVGLCNAPTP
jgi:hypothetical protein